jgi:asparagine synthase (glutamine-hydrolysing)
MCGIAGIYSAQGTTTRDVGRMVNLLRHRGPDACGLASCDQMVLGHTRLSILDLNLTGNQPMSSRSGRFICVFNGEIYNFSRFKSELEARGHKFAGSSDTEVLVEGFAIWGAAFIPRLRGMFALAIWDQTEKHLFIARDQLGKKPFFIMEDGKHGFAFSSELRALRAVRTLTLNETVLGLYFRFGYVPEPETIYQEVRTLPPGCFGWWRPGQGLEVRQYWQPRIGGVENGGVKETEPNLDELDELLYKAVQRRTLSDVPFGSFLSSGVDSALIACYLTKVCPGAPTITVGFDQTRWDESAGAAATASLLDTHHIVEMVQLPEAEPILDEYVACFDQPFADSSGAPTLVLSRITRRHVTVALGGDGGDEVFCGYDRYRWLRSALRTRQLAGGLCLALAPLAGLLPRRGMRIKEMLEAGDEADLYGILSRVWHATAITNLIKVAHRNPDEWFRAKYPRIGGSPVARAQLYDLMAELPFDILVKLDRATMWHGLEARCPLLDIEVVEWVANNDLLGPRSDPGKKLLKALLKRRLPGYDFRRPKRGFALPVEVWLRGPLAHRLDAAADPSWLAEQGLFAAEHVRAVIRRFRDGARELYAPLWCFLAFQEWYRAHYLGETGSTA